jgi:gliding motility-associated-like protein
LIKNKKGETVGTIHEPLCFDQNRNYTVASYVIEKLEDKLLLSIKVPEDWLLDNERAYPVIVDPIIQGPTSTWGGGQMPSCFMPAYNQDSIQVFIPADITVTELNVTASFYADPFTGAWMQDGSMYFSTDCDNSQTFTITGAPGQSAGTAYLDYFNLFNPLTCCFPESCNIQNFWLSYHLGRNLWGSGCNTTYIRYDPVTTSWPYEAVVVGHTAEHISAEWNVPPVLTCTNDCEINGIAYVAYGVPPYTFTHPWSNDTIIQGVNNGCSNGSTTYNFDLTVPNCPIYCDTINTTLSVPPPVIWDACGNSVSPAMSDDLPLKPAPGFNPVYDTLVCSGDPFVIDLAMCPSTASMSWTGNGVTAWVDTISDVVTNTSGAITMVNYTAYALLNGCNSDTIDVPIYIHPAPDAAYNTDPDPIISGVEVNFIDASTFDVSPVDYWFYDFGDGDTSWSQNPTHLYPSPGEYYVCMTVANQAGCIDSICTLVPVAPAEVLIPNVVTANNDGVNDLLEFKYLEFYPDNQLTVLNRWGNVIYEAEDYQNDWNPQDHTEGTYFLILKLNAIETEYSGFFQIIK